MSCFPIEDKKKKEVKNATMLNMAFAIGLVLFSSMVLVGSVSAATDINWSQINAMVDGVAGIMPSISNLVVAIVPTILLLIVVGFLTGVFDGIIGGITGAFGKLGR